MKVIRLEIPARFIDVVGAKDIFEDIESLEIHNAFQYDRDNFFSLQTIRFIPGSPSLENLEFFLTEQFNAHFIQIINQRGPEIFCILNQNLATGFFKTLEPGPWAIVFPLLVTREHILLNLISPEYLVPKLYKLLSQFVDDYKVIGISEFERVESEDLGMGDFSFPWPKFTSRQKEILQYAAEQGYFESPKQITGREIAEYFGISESSINDHIRNAQNTAMRFFFGNN